MEERRAFNLLTMAIFSTCVTAGPIYLQTATGDYLEVDIKLGLQCPYISDAFECRFGFSRSHPVCLSPGVEKEAVEMIFGYFQFYGVPSHSCEFYIDEFLKKDKYTLWMLLRAANFLQLQGLFEMIRDILVRYPQKRIPEVQQDLFKSFEHCLKMAEPIYLQTATYDYLEVDIKLGRQCPYICDALECGFGFSRSHPVCLSPVVEKEAVEMIFGYFQLSRVPGDSCECQFSFDEFLKKDQDALWMLLRAAKCLQLQGLFEMIRNILVQNTQKNVPEVEQESNSFELRVKGDELERRKNPNVDIRTRLSHKLLEKQKKKLNEVVNLKKAEAELEVQKREDCSIDDLLCFINGDGDTKGGQTSKKKKKNRIKGKEKKKTLSGSAFASTEAPALKEVSENREQDMNESGSANRSGFADDALKILGTQDESINVEGDYDDNDLDPAKMKEIDRDVEELAKRFLEWELELKRRAKLKRTNSCNI
ncbi:hypothetical protein AgCh_027383 [Apium graveolens]